MLRQPGHPHDFAGNGDDELCAVVDDDVVDFQLEIFCYAIGFGVGREGELRLGDADREMSDIHPGDVAKHLFRAVAELDFGCTVNIAGDFGDLGLDGILLVVRETEGGGGGFVDGSDN